MIKLRYLTEYGTCTVMTCSVRIKFGTDKEIEATGETSSVLSFIVNEATKKFFGKSIWTSYEMST